MRRSYHSGIRPAGSGNPCNQPDAWRQGWHDSSSTGKYRTVIRQEDETSAEGINARLEKLQKELLKLANSKKDYNSVADEIDRLRELKQKALTESAEREGLKKRIAEMREFLNSQPTEVLEYDEQLVRRLIEKVTVYEERFEVEFKSGMKVDVER